MLNLGSGEDLGFADVNGDGALDIIAGPPSFTGFVSVLINNGNGTFATPKTYESGGGRGSLNVADVNADGRVDIVVSNGGEGNYAAVLYGRCL
jgi:hypothetical protein